MNHDRVDRIMEILDYFRVSRGFERAHNPKELATSISVEAGELLAEFVFNEGPFGETEGIRDELADVLIGCFNLCSVLGLDPLQLIEIKAKKNAIKYPRKE